MAIPSDKVAAGTAVQQPENNLAVEKDEYWRYIDLHKAIIRGEWNCAKKFFDEHEGALTAPINEYEQTALFVAVGRGEESIDFVEKLVELMPVEALERPQHGGDTVLHAAAWVGNTKAAKVLVQKHPRLLYIPGFEERLPVHLAALSASKETFLYLLSVTKDDPVCKPFSNRSGVRLLNYAIASKFVDVALNLVHDHPQLATEKVDNPEEWALQWIAKKVTVFPSGSRLDFWQRLIYKYVSVESENCAKDHNTDDIENPINGSRAPILKDNFFISVGRKLQAMLWKVLSVVEPRIKYIKDIREKKLMHLKACELVKCLCKEIRSLNDSKAYDSFAKEAIIEATKLGIHEVVEEIVESFPKLIFTTDPKKYGIFHRTVIHRHENVFNLIYQISDHKPYITWVRDKSENTILHMADCHLKKNSVKFLVQFCRCSEVETLVRPGYRDLENKQGKTPAVIFSNTHKKLVDEGEKWMKETANSCTVAAALIATVVFAAAITVPGGNDGANGLPIFSAERAFIVFAVADAISLFTSTTSLMMFLSILTSRCEEHDFHYDLPKRLIIGLVTLFVSITTMMVAFSATLYIVFGRNKAWVVIPVVVLAGLPITSFVSLQFPLLVDLIYSTYGPGIFRKQRNYALY